MKRITILFLVLTLLLTACSGITAPTDAPTVTEPPIPVPTQPTTEAIKDPAPESCLEKLGAYIPLVRIIHVIEHKAQFPVLIRICRDRLAARPRTKMHGKFPCAETGLMIALAFFQSPPHDIAELAGIVSGGCLIRHIEVRLDHISHILQDHGSPLLNGFPRRDIELCIATIHNRPCIFG